MFIVTLDRPYYPSVSYCETLEEAHARRDEILREDAEPDGVHQCKVVIARVVESRDIRTHY